MANNLRKNKRFVHFDVCIETFYLYINSFRLPQQNQVVRFWFQLWNSLPEVAKQAETSEQFKTRLKTYLLTLYKLLLFCLPVLMDLTVIRTI